MHAILNCKLFSPLFFSSDSCCFWYRHHKFLAATRGMREKGNVSIPYSHFRSPLSLSNTALSIACSKAFAAHGTTAPNEKKESCGRRKVWRLLPVHQFAPRRSVWKFAVRHAVAPAAMRLYNKSNQAQKWKDFGFWHNYVYPILR